MTRYTIPFTRVHLTGRELDYIREAIERNHLSGDGTFTRRCQAWLEENTGCAKALLTHSGTAALEMAAILSDVGPGDEVILPSFTFSSTANAFVLRGATPVFVDIEPVRFNIDPDRIAAAITPRTKAVVPVHYAGAACDMETIGALAREHDLLVIEDAAQALLATDGTRPLGSIGQLAALSFHETKNVSAGEAGALLINDRRFLERAEIVREKGTNRSRFFRGEVDKYTWVDAGSSYLPSELVAAFLLAQLEAAQEITARRVAIWQRYHEALAPFEGDRLRRPRAGSGNGHIYPVLLRDEDARQRTIDHLKSRGISAVFHYVPLHSSPAGVKHGRTCWPMDVTDDVSRRLLRLPLWPDMTDEQLDLVAAAVAESL